MIYALTRNDLDEVIFLGVFSSEKKAQSIIPEKVSISEGFKNYISSECWYEILPMEMDTACFWVMSNP